MRTAFIKQLIVEARLNPRLFLIVGDLGYSVVEPFANEFPDRFLNAGVAEQNMTGVAAGLASEGWNVFTYSIANFPTLRCFEQIRNDIAYHGLPVTVVSVGGGMAYGNLGYSHHAVQDIAVMRTLPGFTVFAPADPGETRECVTALARRPRPAYLRLGKAGEPDLHEVRGVEGGPLLIRPGGVSLALVSTGGMLKTALEVFDLLKARGRDAAVFSFPQLKPVSVATVAPLASFPIIAAIEEHVAEGGLASILREHLGGATQIRSMHVSEKCAAHVGSQEYLRTQAMLSAQQVADSLMA